MRIVLSIQNKTLVNDDRALQIGFENGLDTAGFLKAGHWRTGSH